MRRQHSRRRLLSLAVGSQHKPYHQIPFASKKSVLAAQKWVPRPSDVIITTYSKTGTTWSVAIFDLLRCSCCCDSVRASVRPSVRPSVVHVHRPSVSRPSNAVPVAVACENVRAAKTSIHFHWPLTGVCPSGRSPASMPVVSVERKGRPFFISAGAPFFYHPVGQV